MKIDELVKTLNAVFHRVEILEKSMATKRDIDIETNIVVARIVDVERDVERLKTTVHPAFDPEVTLVPQGLKESGRDLLSDVKELVHEVLNEPEVTIKRVLRIASRNAYPGIVKIEVDSTQNKIKVLRKKGMLIENNGVYRNVFLRSSKSHVERLLELNTKKLLDELPNGNKFRISANGRLIEKNNWENQQRYQRQQRPEQQHQRPEQHYQRHQRPEQQHQQHQRPEQHHQRPEQQHQRPEQQHQRPEQQHQQPEQQHQQHQRPEQHHQRPEQQHQRPEQHHQRPEQHYQQAEFNRGS